MLFPSPPTNLPLTRLPFFSSNESASTADTARHITKTNPKFRIRFILLVLYVLSVLPSVHNALPIQRAGIVDGCTGRQFLRLHSPPHGTLGCSTLGGVEHCRGMECARISGFAGFSWTPPIDSFLVAQFSDWCPLRSTNANCRFFHFPPPVRRPWAYWDHCDPPDLQNHPR